VKKGRRKGEEGERREGKGMGKWREWTGERKERGWKKTIPPPLLSHFKP